MKHARLLSFVLVLAAALGGCELQFDPGEPESVEQAIEGEVFGLPSFPIPGPGPFPTIPPLLPPPQFRTLEDGEWTEYARLSSNDSAPSHVVSRVMGALEVHFPRSQFPEIDCEQLRSANRSDFALAVVRPGKLQKMGPGQDGTGWLGCHEGNNSLHFVPPGPLLGHANVTLVMQVPFRTGRRLQFGPYYFRTSAPALTVRVHEVEHFLRQCDPEPFYKPSRKHCDMFLAAVVHRVDAAGHDPDADIVAEDAAAIPATGQYDQMRPSDPRYPNTELVTGPAAPAMGLTIMAWDRDGHGPAASRIAMLARAVGFTLERIGEIIEDATIFADELLRGLGRGLGRLANINDNDRIGEGVARLLADEHWFIDRGHRTLELRRRAEAEAPTVRVTYSVEETPPSWTP